MKAQRNFRNCASNCALLTSANTINSCLSVALHNSIICLTANIASILPFSGITPLVAYFIDLNLLPQPLFKILFELLHPVLTILHSKAFFSDKLIIIIFIFICSPELQKNFKGFVLQPSRNYQQQQQQQFIGQHSKTRKCKTNENRVHIIRI